MAQFVDNEDRTWDVVIDVNGIRNVRNRLGYNLAKLTDNELRDFLEIAGDPVKLADTLFVLCEKQATAKGLTDEDFGRGLAGDAIGAAADAFYEAMVLFSPSQVREPLRALARKTKEVQSLVAAQKTEIVRQIEAADPQLMLDAISSPIATGSQVLSALTPAPGRYESLSGAAESGNG